MSADQYYPKAEFGFKPTIELERIHNLMIRTVEISMNDIVNYPACTEIFRSAVAWFADTTPRENPFSFWNICEELDGSYEFLASEVKRIVRDKREQANVEFVASIRPGSLVEGILYQTQEGSFAHTALPTYALYHGGLYTLLTIVQGRFKLGAFSNPVVPDCRCGFVTHSETVDSIVEKHFNQYSALRQSSDHRPAWLETNGHLLARFENSY